MRVGVNVSVAVGVRVTVGLWVEVGGRVEVGSGVNVTLGVKVGATVNVAGMVGVSLTGIKVGVNGTPGGMLHANVANRMNTPTIPTRRIEHLSPLKIYPPLL